MAGQHRDPWITSFFALWLERGRLRVADTDKNKPSRPTVQAIAKSAGVSRATVSLILANRHELVRRFKPETIAKVRRIAREMGYHANIMATSLRSRHPSFFGLILRGAGQTDAASWHHQAFEGRFLAGALEASRELQLYPVLATQESPDAEGALNRVRGVLDGGVRGAVLRTPLALLDETIQRLLESGLPVAIVFPERPTECKSNTIDVDNVQGGRIAAHLLKEAGRKRWVIIREEPPWEAIQLREQGALHVAQEAGIEVQVLGTPSGVAEDEKAEWLMPRLRDLRPDGVYADSSVTSIAALRACEASGMRVPDDVSLVGCDASLWRAPGSPTITSVDASWYEAGSLAVRKIEELSQRAESVFENVVLPPRVQPGDSCAVGPRVKTASGAV